MSGELEAAGALATASIVGAAIEGREGGAPGEGKCLNCGAEITGRFCSNCGQHTAANRKLVVVVAEFLHNLWQIDTKTWRTLPMVIFRPGTLTRNYVYGKRARYLAPLTMFLFSIFLMFFAFSTIEAPINLRDDEIQATTADLAEARGELAQAQADLAEARANPDPDEPAGLEAGIAQGAVNIAQAEVERLERQLADERVRAEQEQRQQGIVISADPPPDATAAEQPPTQTAEQPSASPPGAAGQRTSTWQESARDIASSEDFTVIDGADALNERVRKKFENPDLALYQIQDAASKFSFLLAPMSLPFIWLLFLWKRGVTLYDHMAYALYALAFAALLFSAVTLLEHLPNGGAIGGTLLLALPVHMFFHLGGTYGLGWWSALWRTFFMLFFAFIVALAFAILVVVMGLAG